MFFQLYEENGRMQRVRVE